MYRILYCICFVCFIQESSSAQKMDEACATKVPDMSWEKEFELLIKQNQEKKHFKTLSTHYTIPVIFHILHSGQAVGAFPNITAAQTASQISVLNNDFAGKGTFVSKYPANAFKNWAINQSLPTDNIDGLGRVKIADFDIEFCLALKDEKGNLLSEPGINRIDCMTKGWKNPESITDIYALISYFDSVIKPASIWDVTKYLNIWVSDKSSSILFAGYATMPPLSTLTGINAIGTDTTDGVWCSASALGSYLIYPSGSYVSSTVIGQVATHEVGHWLGLRHIWGDMPCGTDYCNDTPPALEANTANPIYPLHVGSCSSPSNSPDGEMYMNFMDYTYGEGKYMFTVDQAVRAQTAMQYSPFRKLLGTHHLCSATNIETKNADEFALTVSPNPTEDMVTINTPKSTIQSIQLFNAIGILLGKYSKPNISFGHLPNGVYYLIIQMDGHSYHQKVIKY